VVWFVIAMVLFCRDSYRQVFRWLHRFRKGGTPGRSTLCKARRSLVVLYHERWEQELACPDLRTAHTNPTRKRGPGRDIASLAHRVRA
jgi:hypothetical protein